MSKILLTGGGTAGHATPNIALIPTLEKDGHTVIYIGTKNGIERELVEKTGVKYFPISAGKLRRYISAENIKDIFRVFKGYREAKGIIKAEKPDIVFSKGGFVTVPVVYAASSLNIPVVIHESDMTPGLANKLCIKKAKKICVSFETTKENIKADKCVLTGLPVRNELFCGSREKGLDFLKFDGKKQVLMIIGGSLGAQAVNEAVDNELDGLLDMFDIAHIRGKGKLNPACDSKPGYRQFEYLAEELTDVMAAADAVLSRAGANVIFELLALKKPMLLVPLPIDSSRGDQILNAEHFRSKGFAHVIEQSSLKNGTLKAALGELLKDADNMRAAMSQSNMNNGAKNVIDVIYSVMEKSR